MNKFIKDTGKVYDATPSYKLIETMGYGTYTLETAISDIIDNSITAEASLIEIDFKIDDESDGSYVEIRDNGFGMTSDELMNAMIFSGKGVKDERSENDLGKYGLGMKTASFYACKCLTVISKTKKTHITAKRLDQENIYQSQKWVGSDLDGAEELGLYSFPYGQGTVVRWDKLSIVDEGKNRKKYFHEKIKQIAEHLGLYFHRFLESNKIKIIINGNYEVRAWNPIFQDFRTNRIELKTMWYKDSPIKIESYLLPSVVNLTDAEVAVMTRGDALSLQGFYVYRNDRLLIAGGWLGIPKLSSHQQYNAVRIIMDIPTQLDADFKVDFTKSAIKLPKEVEIRCKEIAKTVRSKASEAAKNRAKYVPQVGIKNDVLVWHIMSNDKGVTLKINENHPLIKQYTKGIDKDNIKKLLKLLSTSVPVLKTNDDVVVKYTDNEIINILEQFMIIQLSKGKTLDDIKMDVYNMEPFIHYISVVQTYFEEVAFNGDGKL